MEPEIKNLPDQQPTLYHIYLIPKHQKEESIRQFLTKPIYKLKHLVVHNVEPYIKQAISSHLQSLKETCEPSYTIEKIDTAWGLTSSDIPSWVCETTNSTVLMTPNEYISKQLINTSRFKRSYLDITAIPGEELDTDLKKIIYDRLIKLTRIDNNYKIIPIQTNHSRLRLINLKTGIIEEIIEICTDKILLLYKDVEIQYCNYNLEKDILKALGITLDSKFDAYALKKLAYDIVSGKVFLSSMVREQRLLGSIFMPLLFLNSELALMNKWSEIDLLYEYLDKAGPRSINGYPMFTSYNYLNRYHSRVLYRYIRKY